MSYPKISAMSFNGESWAGWSNSKTHDLESLADAVSRIQDCLELAYIIIDADNFKIWLSDLQYSERAKISAKDKFGVEIANIDIQVGFPN